MGQGGDLKHPEFCDSDANEFELLDLRRWENCKQATSEIDEIYALAADSGIPDQARTSHSNYLINLNCIEAARQNRIARYLYVASASIYPRHGHRSTNCIPLKEEDAFPGASQDAHGWVNLVAERLCVHYRQDYGLETRVVRLPEVFGPIGPWLGGRESAPAALCRKIATAHLEGLHEIEVCGDGEAKSSFCYIDDCVTALHKVMKSDFSEPLNVGQNRMISMDELTDMIASIVGVQVSKVHIEGSQGTCRALLDNTRLKEALRWEPQTSSEEGLRLTYVWVEQKVKELALEFSFGVASFPVQPPRPEH